jgi:hypothetical protein
MKIKLLLSILLSLLVHFCYCQVSFGVKSGINIATTKDLIAFPKNTIGWYGGGFANIPLHEEFFLQLELLYSTKGHRSDGLVGDSKMITRLNYLTAPILIGYKIDRRTCLTFGPEIGYLTSAHLVISNNEKLDVSKNYPPKFDVSLLIGLNYNIIEKMGIEICYNYGVKDLYSIDAVGNRFSNTKGANRVFQIGINYYLK